MQVDCTASRPAWFATTKTTESWWYERNEGTDLSRLRYKILSQSCGRWIVNPHIFTECNASDLFHTCRKPTTMWEFKKILLGKWKMPGTSFTFPGQHNCCSVYLRHLLNSQHSPCFRLVTWSCTSVRFLPKCERMFAELPVPPVTELHMQAMSQTDAFLLDKHSPSSACDKKIQFSSLFLEAVTELTEKLQSLTEPKGRLIMNVIILLDCTHFWVLHLIGSHPFLVPWSKYKSQILEDILALDLDHTDQIFRKREAFQTPKQFVSANYNADWLLKKSL